MKRLRNGAQFCDECGESVNVSVQEGYLKPGMILQGRYTAGCPFGQGDIGISYAGYDCVLDKKVAILEYYIPVHSLNIPVTIIDSFIMDNKTYVITEYPEEAVFEGFLAALFNSPEAALAVAGHGRIYMAAKTADVNTKKSSEAKKNQEKNKGKNSKTAKKSNKLVIIIVILLILLAAAAAGYFIVYKDSFGWFAKEDSQKEAVNGKDTTANSQADGSGKNDTEDELLTDEPDNAGIIDTSDAAEGGATGTDSSTAEGDAAGDGSESQESGAAGTDSATAEGEAAGAGSDSTESGEAGSESQENGETGNGSATAEGADESAAEAGTDSEGSSETEDTAVAINNPFEDYTYLQEGAEIIFGTAEDGSPYRWVITDLYGTTALVVSAEAVANDKNIGDSYTEVYHWLNSDFYDNTFNADEMARIITVYWSADECVEPIVTDTVAINDKIFDSNGSEDIYPSMYINLKASCGAHVFEKEWKNACINCSHEFVAVFVPYEETLKTIKKTVRVRRMYYSSQDNVVETLGKGVEVPVIGYLISAVEEHKWYVTADGYYIYEDNLE
ncbi:MAG: hypothetical protein MJ131_03060 [Lachnospiraceae bacterium]|nr:hypothetical protein [Lachnospiraceae bacterium]